MIGIRPVAGPQMVLRSLPGLLVLAMLVCGWTSSVTARPSSAFIGVAPAARVAPIHAGPRRLALCDDSKRPFQLHTSPRQRSSPLHGFRANGADEDTSAALITLSIRCLMPGTGDAQVTLLDMRGTNVPQNSEPWTGCTCSSLRDR
jgi:hypothetical protein